jgi:lysophospholipase L1-like esterase
VSLSVRFGVRAVALMALAGAGLGLASSAAGATSTPPAHAVGANVVGPSATGPFYLALGDSVPVWDGNQSYPNLLLAHYQSTVPNLQLVNLAVSGETTSSMLMDGQYAAAIAFLHAHPDEVDLITIDIGGNDVVGCASASGLDEACFQQALVTMSDNISTILHGLHEAAPLAPVFGMTYYDPFLGNWLAGGATATQTLAGIPDAVTLNDVLTTLYGPTHTADVQGAFAVTDDTDLVSSPWGTVPVDVDDACQWLDITCTPGQPEGFGDDPNVAGQVQIAQAFERLIGAQGYWEVGGDGGVFNFGITPFAGSLGGTHLNAPVVGASPTSDGEGYWLAAADGGVFSFGDANYFGSMGGRPLDTPIVGMAATPDGGGYWLVASDGGVFAFGDASYFGSMGGQPLSAPMVGITANPNGTGYWTVAADGGVFSFGGAPFEGSEGGQHLDGSVVAIASTPRTLP